MAEKRRVKLAHVALAAGVSKGTASDALRDSSRVSQATKAKVRRVAAELGYTPDVRGRSLSRGAMPLVGISSDIPDLLTRSDQGWLFWPQVLSGVCAALTAGRVGVVLIRANEDDSLADLPVDLLVYISDRPTRPPTSRLPADVPTYFISLSPTSQEPGPVDQLQVLGAEAVQHLHERGARRLVAISSQSDDVVYGKILAGAQRWCADHTQQWTILSATEAESQGVLQPGDGIFVLSGGGEQALALLQRCGLSAPTDVLLLCLSDGLAEQYLTPKVSTISIRGDRAGALYGESLLQLYREGTLPDFEPPWDLYARETTLPSAPE